MGVSNEIGSWASNKPQLLDGHFHACGDFFFSGLRPISCESSGCFLLRDGFVEVNRQSDSAGRSAIARVIA